MINFIIIIINFIVLFYLIEYFNFNCTQHFLIMDVREVTRAPRKWGSPNHPVKLAYYSIERVLS